MTALRVCCVDPFLSQADDAIAKDLAHTEDHPMSFDQYFDYFIGRFGGPPMEGDVGPARRAKMEKEKGNQGSSQLYARRGLARR